MVITDKAEVTFLLTEIGLNFDGLIEVILYADGERALCSAYDPRGFDLITMNARAARRLRERFCGKHWEPDDTDNQAGIRNPKTKVRIIHCNFDRNAGNRFANPTNLAEKGAASRSKVACNQTPWLPGLPMPPEDQSGKYSTYVLGTYYDKDTDVLRAELSRPRSFMSGRYKRFEPRIILLDGSEGAPQSGIRPVREGPTEVVDISVTRK